MNLYSIRADLAVSSPCESKHCSSSTWLLCFSWQLWYQDTVGRDAGTSYSGGWYCDDLSFSHVAGVFSWYVELVPTDQLDTCHLAEQFTHRGTSIGVPINYSQKVSSWSWLLRRKCKNGMMEALRKEIKSWNSWRGHSLHINEIQLLILMQLFPQSVQHGDTLGYPESKHCYYFLMVAHIMEKEMATHSSILAGKIPWTEEPGGPQSTGWQELDTT